MKTLLVIFSHSKANDTVARHWPWFTKGGCDILGVGRTNTNCIWPCERNLIGTMRVGLEGYAEGDNHILRFLETLTALMTDAAYKEYGAFCFIEYDSLLFRPIPEIKPGEFIAKLAGGRDGDFRGTSYYHTPWAFDRIMAGRLLKHGFAMWRAGLIERGFLDRWFGLMDDLYELGIKDTGDATYTQNTIDTPEKIADCRRAIEAGIWYSHGIKSAAVLQAVTEGIT